MAIYSLALIFNVTDSVQVWTTANADALRKTFALFLLRLEKTKQRALRWRLQ